MPSVEISVNSHVATVVLNRPEAMNAIDPEMRGLLHQAWDRLRTDEDIWVAIITGSGDKAFCTGSDLKKTMPSSDPFARQIFGEADSSATVTGLAMDKPLIAAVNGYAIGGGMELALACDIRIASENAQFALSEVKVGSIPGSGGTQRLPRMVAMSDAMLMLLTGDRVNAREAHRMGLVSEVTPQGELLAVARKIAERITSNAPLSVRAIKRLVFQGIEMPLAQAMDAERYVFGLIYGTEDRIEGRRAFAEKRKPNYKGR